MYSELEDVRHRHSIYYDSYSIHGWIDTPDSGFLYNVARCLGISLIASGVGNLSAFYFGQYKLIRTRYDPPESLAQVTSYLKAAHTASNAGAALKFRAQSAAFGAIDWAARLLAFKFFVGGISQTVSEGVNTDFWRRGLPYVFAGFLSSPACVPFAAAKAAYVADQTFPAHLRSGYRSPFDALCKLAVRSPLKLIQNAPHLMVASALQASFLLSNFELLMEIFTPIHDPTQENGRFWCKVVASSFATGSAAAVAYPLMVSVPNAVETGPTQLADGLLKKNYRKAIMHFWTMDSSSLTPWTGFFKSGFAFKQIPLLFAMIWTADSFGLTKGARNSPIQMPGATSWITRYN